MGLGISVWEVFVLLCFYYLHKGNKSPAILQFITRYYNSSQERGLQSISTGGKSSHSIGVQSISGSSQSISGKSQFISGKSQLISGSFQSTSGSSQSTSGSSAGVEVGLWVFFISQRYGKFPRETNPGGVWRAGILEDLPESGVHLFPRPEEDSQRGESVPSYGGVSGRVSGSEETG